MSLLQVIPNVGLFGLEACSLFTLTLEEGIKLQLLLLFEFKLFVFLKLFHMLFLLFMDHLDFIH